MSIDWWEVNFNFQTQVRQVKLYIFYKQLFSSEQLPLLGRDTQHRRIAVSTSTNSYKGIHVSMALRHRVIEAPRHLILIIEHITNI